MMSWWNDCCYSPSHRAGYQACISAGQRVSVVVAFAAAALEAMAGVMGFLDIAGVPVTCFTQANVFPITWAVGGPDCCL
jgi:hypothetical protein